MTRAYPGDGERHVEVFAALQSEAPGRGAVQGHRVRAHLGLRVDAPADSAPALLSWSSVLSLRSCCPASEVSPLSQLEVAGGGRVGGSAVEPL